MFVTLKNTNTQTYFLHILKTKRLCYSADYLEAVAAHPAIGDKQALRDKFAPSRSGWEGAEQAAAAGASEVG